MWSNDKAISGPQEPKWPPGFSSRRISLASQASGQVPSGGEGDFGISQVALFPEPGVEQRQNSKTHANLTCHQSWESCPWNTAFPREALVLEECVSIFDLGEKCPPPPSSQCYLLKYCLCISAHIYYKSNIIHHLKNINCKKIVYSTYLIGEDENVWQPQCKGRRLTGNGAFSHHVERRECHVAQYFCKANWQYLPKVKTSLFCDSVSSFLSNDPGPTVVSMGLRKGHIKIWK